MPGKTIKQYAVLTGDVIGSTNLPLSIREELPKSFRLIFDSVKDYAKGDIVTPIEIFQGDSFQFVISDPSISPRIALMFIAHLKSIIESQPIDAKIAIGVGTIDFLPDEHQNQGGGEAYTLSGRALSAMGKGGRISLKSSSQTFNDELAVMLKSLGHIISDWTAKQAAAVYCRIKGMSQKDIAEEIGISQSAVSQRLVAAGMSQVKSILSSINLKLEKCISDRTMMPTVIQPDASAQRREQFKAASKPTSDFRITNIIPSSKILYEHLTKLANDNPDQPANREAQAKVAFYLVTQYGEAGDIPSAWHQYDLLATLAKSHPDESAIRLEQAKAAVILINTYSDANDIMSAHELYKQLAMLVDANPDELAIRVEQAKAAVKLITAYGLAEDIQSARALYAQLVMMADTYPEEMAVQMSLTRATVKLIAYYSLAGDIRSAQGLYNQLATLTDNYPEERVIRALQAEAAFYFLYTYTIAKDIPSARSLYNRIRAIADSHPDEIDIRQIYAKAAFIMIIALIDASMFDEAEKEFNRLSDIMPSIKIDSELFTGYIKLRDIIRSRS